MTAVKDALRRLQHYVAMRRAKPLLGLGDNIHSIHTGTEWEAELLFSDLCAVADEAKKDESELVAAVEAYKKAITANALELRNDWSEFDGRDLLRFVGGENEKLDAILSKHAKKD